MTRRYTVYFYAILAGAAMLYGALNPEYRTGALNDDAVYVIAAHDLLSHHPLQTYVQVRPDFPFPGLPFLLAPLATLVDPHWTLLESVSVVVTIFSVFLLGLWVKKWMSPRETLAVLAIYAFNPFVARYSGIVMPGPYITVAAIASFLLMSELLEAPTLAKSLGLGLVLTWGSLMRPEGVLLLGSVAAGLATSRRWKEMARVLTIPVWAWVAFALHLARHPSVSMEYGKDLSALLVYWPQHIPEGAHFAAKFFKIIFMNTVIGFRAPSTPLWQAMSVLTILLASTLIAIGARDIWREQRLARPVTVAVSLFVCLYIAIHIFWHIAIARYTVILVPLILPFIVRGVDAGLIKAGRPKAWAAILALVVIGVYGTRNMLGIHRSLWARDPMYAPPWQSIEWIRTQTPPDTHILSPVAPSITLYTRRSAMSIISASNAEDFMSLLLKVHLDYIMDREVMTLTTGLAEADRPDLKWARIRYWIKLHPKWFPLLYQNGPEKTALYQIVPEDGFFDAYELYIAAIRDLQTGQVESAMQNLHQSLLIDPRLGSATNALASIYVSQGKLTEAEEALKKTVANMPDSTIAMLNLAILNHIRGREGESQRYLQMGLNAGSASGEPQIFIRNARAAASAGQLALPNDFPLN